MGMAFRLALLAASVFVVNAAITKELAVKMSQEYLADLKQYPEEVKKFNAMTTAEQDAEATKMELMVSKNHKARSEANGMPWPPTPESLAEMNAFINDKEMIAVNKEIFKLLPPQKNAPPEMMEYYNKIMASAEL